jgi:hypothetical protein
VDSGGQKHVLLAVPSLFQISLWQRVQAPRAELGVGAWPPIICPAMDWPRTGPTSPGTRNSAMDLISLSLLGSKSECA